MKDAGKVDIKLIDCNPSWRDRNSRWTESMDSFLTHTLLPRSGMPRILAQKSGSRYVVVAGHHLLKAARQCGLREVYVDVMESDAAREAYLDRFTEIITDYCRKRGGTEVSPQACSRL